MNNMIDDSKVFFNPGDVVMVKHNIDNRPKMMVKEKATSSMKDKDGHIETIFRGITTRWFDKNGVLHEAVFSTKDLIHVE